MQKRNLLRSKKHLDEPFKIQEMDEAKKLIQNPQANCLKYKKKDVMIDSKR